nr:MAG TPA: hypothetical protein [Caudoviricetes sp.]
MWPLLSRKHPRKKKLSNHLLPESQWTGVPYLPFCRTGLLLQG